MDSQKSKKTRSYGETSKSLRNSRASRTSASNSRPSTKDRTHSAPLVIPDTRHESVNDPPRILRGKDNGDDSRRMLASVTPPQAKATQNSNAFVNVNIPKPMIELNLAVVGGEKVGKSSFIRCALDLKKPTSSPISSKRVSLEDDVFLISLFELQIADVDITDNEHIEWPKLFGKKSVPQIDGTLVLCDAMDRSSFDKVPEILNTLSNLQMPFVLVSCKYDNPQESPQIDDRFVHDSCNSSIELFQTSVNAPETQKRCISVILSMLITERPEDPKELNRTIRPRASTVIQPSTAINAQRYSSARGKHGRATSEFTGTMSQETFTSSAKLKAFEHSPTSIVSSTATNLEASETQLNSSATLPDSPNSPSKRRFLVGNDNDNTPDHERSSQDMSTKPRDAEDEPWLPQPRLSSPDFGSAVKPIQEMSGETKEPSDPESFLSSPQGMPPISDSLKEIGLSFDQLIERLLSQPMSKADAKFTAIFLCLYRKFAAPTELLSAVVRRFDGLNDEVNPQIIRISSQLRHLSILTRWVAEYPGDFAHPLTLHNMSGFVARLASNRVFAVAAKEMSVHLDAVSEDDDTHWAYSDFSRGNASTTETSVDLPLSQATALCRESDLSHGIKEKHISDNASSEDVKDWSARHSKTPSTSSSAGRSGSQSMSSTQTLMHSLEAVQSQAQLLIPITRNPLTKVQWHQFMGIPDEEVACELTRIDWILFSSIRPRDLIRHVNLTNDQKKRCKSLEHVNRMINQFNHVAFWVANMVLLRDKPKHRAKALEKFMGIAWKLRQMNNYNSLGAIIAGINGTAVHRLLQTRELVTPQAQKDFMRLEILMGTQKSHFAYRLAWENTTSERIPFLPLHRRDLVSAEEGNRTFVGEQETRINWKKFEVMGEVIVGIQRSQGISYPNINRNVDVQRLVLDGKFSRDDDELYERSIQLEGPGVGETRKIFTWFQR